jgi:hypothetical protein
MRNNQRKILSHPDLEIEISSDKRGNDIYSGKSRRYEPFEATAETAIECFFKFNIQLSEQKVLAALIR